MSNRDPARSRTLGDTAPYRHLPDSKGRQGIHALAEGHEIFPSKSLGKERGTDSCQDDGICPYHLLDM